MITVHQINAVRAQIKTWQRLEQTIAFVPTMGNLHNGHLELVKQAHQYGQKVVASIFVNPMQFGPSEDFLTYPSTLETDQQILEQVGTDLLFAPNADTIYPYGQIVQTRVEVPELSDILCGASRPGHFVGVATVVCKLLNIVQPDVAIFGEKDFQQLLIISRMVEDLNLPVEIVGIPTVREADGLAMSSRNSYLTADERNKAPNLYKILQVAAQNLGQGISKVQIEEQARLALIAAGFKPNYVSIRHAMDLTEAGPDDGDLIILAAAYLGKARLIDNIRVYVTSQ